MQLSLLGHFLASLLLVASLAQLGPWPWWTSAAALGVWFGASSGLGVPSLQMLAGSLLWVGICACLPASEVYMAVDQHIAEGAAVRGPAGWSPEQWAMGFVTCPAGVALSWLWLKRGSRRVLGLVCGLALILILAWNLFWLVPVLTTWATHEPAQFSYDGHLYLKAWYLSKSGLNPFDALVEAVRSDTRHLPLLSVRSSFLFTIWRAIPGNPTGLTLAYLLGCTVALASLGRILATSARPGCRKAAYIAPVLYLPHLVYGLLSSGIFYVEYWGAWFVLLSLAAAANQRYRLSLWCAVAASASREMYWAYLVLLALELGLGRKHLSPRTCLAASSVAVGYQILHFKLGKIALATGGISTAESGHRMTKALYSGFSPTALAACLNYGWNTTLGGQWLWPLCTLLGLLGLVLYRRQAGIASLLGYSLTVLVFFSFANHHQAYAPGQYLPDYLGEAILPFLFLGTGFSISWMLNRNQCKSESLSKIPSSSQ